MSTSDLAYVERVGDRMKTVMTDDELDSTFLVYANMARSCILQNSFDLETRVRVAKMLDSDVDWSRGKDPTEVERGEMLERIRMLEETFHLT